MIVPNYWAEAKQKVRWHDDAGEHSRTLHRFGWSDESVAAAEQHAKDRLEDAVRLHEQGQSVAIREPKIAYNGGDGIPIREEVVSRHGETVVTRNAYGALCLNTPDVLIADVDCEEGRGCGVYLFCFLFSFPLTLLLGRQLGVGWQILVSLVIAAMAGGLLGSLWEFIQQRLYGSAKSRWRDHARKTLKHFPDWSIRLYETPAGWRLMVTHQTFDPRSEVVQEFFRRMRSDPIYVRMCFNQNCFRARVTAKPWRAGIDKPMKPRPGTWPISPNRMPERLAWVEQYQRRAESFAACRFTEHLGGRSVCASAAEVLRLHDEISQSMSGKPLA